MLHSGNQHAQGNPCDREERGWELWSSSVTVIAELPRSVGWHLRCALLLDSAFEGKLSLKGHPLGRTGALCAGAQRTCRWTPPAGLTSHFSDAHTVNPAKTGPSKETEVNTLNGQVAMVTGAGRGIGRGIALALARAGADVALCSRSPDQLHDVAKQINELGGRTLVHLADVSDELAVDGLFQALQNTFGRLDLLINNAGTFEGGPLDQLPVDVWDKVLATNLRGPFLCSRLAMQIMKTQRRGRIINIGSISAHRVRPHSAAYSASKFGLWGLTQATALDGRDHGITCCCIQPGNTLVPRRQSEDPRDAEPMMDLEHVAETVVLAASLPADVCLLEATVLPRDQLYIGRG